ncbi:hypothetical protein PFISCL1PPCAC_26620, partial [Pristionchus fissidentatus]
RSSVMSLVSPAEGILETHVTWDEVEANLQKTFQTTAKLGANKGVVHIGEGNGFLSRIGLINCDWEGVEADEKLPVRFALKMASCLAMKTMEAEIPAETRQLPDILQAVWNSLEAFTKENHNAEVKAYEFFGRFEQKVAVPRCFFTVPFSDENQFAGSIALEYFDNTSVSHIYDTLSVEQVRQIARELGKIQAQSVLHGVVEEKWMGERDVCTSSWNHFTQETIVQMFAQIKELDPSMTKCVDAVCELVPTYYGTNLLTSLPQQYGVPPVLVNGDLWSGHINEHRTCIEWHKIVILQAVHHGTPVEDLLRIAFSALSSDDRRAHMTELLNVIYDSLEETLDGAIPAPYTRQQMMDLYEIAIPHAAFLCSLLLLSLFKTYILAADISEDERTARTKVGIDKIRGVCEDIVSFHVKNEEK